MSRTAEVISSNAKDVTEDLQAFGRDVLKLASALGIDAKERANDIGEAANHQAQATYTKVRAQVGANPALALGMAVGAGVLIGLLVKGRH